MSPLIAESSKSFWTWLIADEGWIAVTVVLFILSLIFRISGRIWGDD